MICIIAADLFLLLTLSRHVFPFHFMHSSIMADMFLPILTLSKCVFPFHELHHHSWHVPTTFNSQQVCISISWAAPSWLTCYHHFQLSASVYLYFMNCAIMADIFLPLSTLRQYVILFHLWDHQDWHVPATFNSQAVCNSILFMAPSSSWLTCSCYFQNFQFVCISILWATPSQLMFLWLLIIRMCVFPFHESWAALSWLTCFCRSSLRQYVVLFYLWYGGTIMADIFCHFQLSVCMYFISWAAPSLTHSCCFQLSGSVYFHFMSSTIMADMFPPLLTLSLWVFLFIFDILMADILPLLTLSGCVFPFSFHEQHNNGLHVPGVFYS